MSLTIELDLNLLSVQMERYVRELGQDGPTVVKTQGRLLIERLIKITPPHSQKQGRAAIARDLRNALGLINDKIIRLPALRQAFRSGDTAAANAILRRIKNGPLAGFEARGFTEDLHTGKRNGRGRVRRSQGVLALTPAAARAYLRKVQKRSGQAKGAFLPALKVVGGSAPGWISRHGGKHGDVADVHLGAVEDDARLTVINKARGMQTLSDADISKTIRYREAAMKTHIARLLQVRAKENNLA